MAITSDSDLVAAMASTPFYKFMYNKGNVTSQVAGSWSSMWKITYWPVSGVTPGAAAICDDTTVGAPTLPAHTTGKTIYLASGTAVASGPGWYVLYDRLAHMGGLNGTLTTAQTVALSPSSLAGTRCLANYSNVDWYLEWYTTTGSTAVTATIGVTYNDASTDTISVAIPASTALSRIIPFWSNSGSKWIATVNTVTLSATTGTAGSFGVTCGVQIVGLPIVSTNYAYKYDWTGTELAQISDTSCLWFAGSGPNTSFNSVFGTMNFVQY